MADTNPLLKPGRLSDPEPSGRSFNAPAPRRGARGLMLAATAALGCLTVAPRAAEACGGFFAPQGVPASVTGRRIVASVAPGRSVLWDQIAYTGDPAEFAWVMPVRPGARVELADSAFFETLDALTTTRITPPSVECGSAGSVGCDATLSLGALDEESGQPKTPVEVIHQATVGPYETVTLSASTPGALDTWLAEHGFPVDPSARPVIDAYVAEGYDFVALRLLPGQGVAQMQPVRVVGFGDALPLRMASIGTGAESPIVLYVIAEGRYRIESLTEVALARGLLSWDFRDESTNYDSLRRSALAQHGGASYLTTFADTGFFTRDPFFETFAEQAVKNGEADSCAPAFPEGGGLVQNPCPPGEPWDSPACGVVTDGIDARRLGCEDLDDLAVALEGMRLEDVWLTRLEMVLPREALSTDLLLGAATTRAPVDRFARAAIAVHGDEACPAGTVPRAGDRADRARWPQLLAAWAIGWVLLLARRARAQRRAATRTAA